MNISVLRDLMVFIFGGLLVDTATSVPADEWYWRWALFGTALVIARFGLRDQTDRDDSGRIATLEKNVDSMDQTLTLMDEAARR